MWSVKTFVTAMPQSRFDCRHDAVAIPGPSTTELKLKAKSRISLAPDSADDANWRDWTPDPEFPRYQTRRTGEDCGWSAASARFNAHLSKAGYRPYIAKQAVGMRAFRSANFWLVRELTTPRAAAYITPARHAAVSVRWRASEAPH